MNARKKKWIEKKKPKSGRFYHEKIEAEISGKPSLKHGIYYHHDRNVNKKEEEMISAQHPSKVDDDTQFVLRRYPKNADLPLPVPPNYDIRRNYGAEQPRKQQPQPIATLQQAAHARHPPMVSPPRAAVAAPQPLYDTRGGGGGAPYDAYSYPSTRDELFFMQMQMQRDSNERHLMHNRGRDMGPMQYQQRMPNRGTMDDAGVWHPYTNNGVVVPIAHQQQQRGRTRSPYDPPYDHQQPPPRTPVRSQQPRRQSPIKTPNNNNNTVTNDNAIVKDNTIKDNSESDGDGQQQKEQVPQQRAKSMSPGKRVNRIQTQLEYYFSVDNMDRDEYLRSLMDSRGWVSVSKIVGFNRMKHLGADKQMVVEAAFHSQLLEVSVKDRQCIRMHKYWRRYRNKNSVNSSNSKTTTTKTSKEQSENNKNSSRKNVQKELDAQELNTDTIAQIVKLIERKAEKRKKRREEREKRKKREAAKKEKEKEKENNEANKENKENNNENDSKEKEKEEDINDESVNNDEEDTKMDKNEENSLKENTKTEKTTTNTKDEVDQEMVDID